jgi:hypothetical protein
METDYTNYLYSIFEADNALLNIRKLQLTKIEFNGLLGKIMNQDPNNSSYIVDKIYETVHLAAKLNLVNQFVIYTDIIQEQYYGGQQQQVLHTMNISNTVPPIIDSPHYVAVNKSVLTSINMRICDRTGEPIKFSDLFSNVLVKLHFRKK